MGVRLYFKREVVANSTALQYDDTQPPQCDRLFLDFNAFCHEQRKRKIDEHGKEAIKDKDIIDGVLESMDKVVDYMKPRELLYIAVDGVAPKAKMIQQRQRRFMKVWQEKHDPVLDPTEERLDAAKDSNEISPGTTFMDSLTKRVKSHIKTKRYKQFQTIFSSADEEGEGEHKIFRYIYTNTPSSTKKCPKDVIHGLDADLIILSLINMKPDIVLMRNHKDSMAVDKELREKAHENNNQYGFIFVHVDKFRKRVCERIQTNELSNEEIMYDYCLLVAFLGNDFLPGLSFISVDNKGIDYILDAYKYIRRTMKQTLVYKENGYFKINWGMVSKLLERMVNDEDTAFNELEERYYNRKVRDVNNIEEYPISNKSLNRVYPNTPGWRMRYNHYHLNSRDGIEGVSESIYLYLCGLQFVVEYYLNQRTYDGWYYPHSLSPTIMDLYMTIEASDVRTIAKNVQNKLDKLQSEYLKPTPKEALLLILPYQSKHIIPKKYHPIMENPRYGCMHYYPKDFVLNTYVKNKLHECKPIIPDINDRKVITQVRKLSK